MEKETRELGHQDKGGGGQGKGWVQRWHSRALCVSRKTRTDPPRWKDWCMHRTVSYDGEGVGFNVKKARASFLGLLLTGSVTSRMSLLLGVHLLICKMNMVMSAWQGCHYMR